MQKTKTRIVVSTLLMLTLVLTVFLGFGATKASAATNRAGVYMLYGTYDIGDGSTSGYMDQFGIQIASEIFYDDSGTNGTTKYNYASYNWTYFSFYIHADDIKEHQSFKLTKDGSTYVSKTLSGSDGMYLWQGSLPSGTYVLTYVGTYKPNIFTTKTYTFKYTFYVDKDSPSYSLKAGGSTIASGAYTNKAITYSYSDLNPNKLYYMSPSSSSYTYTTSTSKTVSATAANNGLWRFYAVDDMNNSCSTVSVYLDTVAPVGTVKNSSGTTIANGGYTNKPVKYSATDTGGVSYYQVKNPGSSSWSSYTANTALSASTGWYTFRAVDKAGNISTEYKVYYDAGAPTGTLYGGTSVKSSGGYTNASYIKYVVSDSYSGIANCYVRKPGSSSYVAYTSGTQLTAEGTYYFYCTDKSGNTSSTVSITLDRTLPVGTLYGGTTSKATGSYTNASYVKYTATDSLSGVNTLYVKMPNSTYYTAYSSGTQLATEGTYYFYSVDRAGNQSSTVSITLDKTKPVGTLYGGTSVITSGGSTNASYIKFVPSDNISLNTTYVKKPGSSSYESYTSGTQLTAEGVYSFYSIDRAGNTSSTYAITLDRQIPTAQLYVDGKPVSNNTYTNGEHISFECGENCFVKLPDSDTFVSYLSGAEYYKPGKYVFYGVDSANNSTGYYSIVIDRTVKTVQISNVTDGTTNGDATITWTDGDTNLYAPIKSVTINGKSYTKGEIIHTIDTGVYKIVVTDRAGNTWNTEFSSTKKNIMTDTLQKEYYEINDADGEYFAFASYESALEFAKARESSFVRKGEWKSESWDTGIAMDAIDAANAVNGEYFIYKKSGNPDEWVAYFTVERLNQVIEEYAKVGIESYYYWEKEPSTIAEGENLFTYSADKNILANSVTLGDNIGASIDGVVIVDNVIETEGKHILVVSDDWGNTCEYNLVIVRNTPDIEYAVGEGNANTVTFDRVYYFKDQVTVSINDAYDEMAMFSIYDEDGELIGHFSIDDVHTLTESGSYTVVSVNHAGKSEVFNLVISRNAPKVEVNDNEEKKQLNITIVESVDNESHLQTLEIHKSTDGGETWVVVEKDDYGTVVSLDTLSYSFRTTGIYKVTITDEFRTGIDAVTAQINYVQENPVGTLNGVENNGYTNDKVTFEWDDEAIVTLTKDGAVIEYESGDELIEDGVYTLTFENYDGYKATYSFIIDTAAPEIKTDGANNRESVNQDVKVFYTEENLTAELFKDGKSLGEYVSGNPISADGQYRVRVADQAGNEVSVEFTIDKTVDYAINVYDKGLSNSVVATANEQVTVALTKDGNAVDYALGSAITEPADYVLVLTDALNNRAEISFKIVEPVVKAFSHNFDEIEGLGGVTVNGNDHRLNYGTLELKDDGVYEVGVIVSGKTYTFKVTVDTLANYTANVHNGGLANSVTIKTDENVTVTVTKNGIPYDYTVGKEITEPAKYTVKVSDAVGNTSEFSFTIVNPVVNKFDQEIDNVAAYEKVLVNGKEATLDRGSLILTESGSYEVAVIANGVTRTFKVTVDRDVSYSANVHNGGYANTVKISGNESLTVSATKNGEAFAYELGAEITDPATYVVKLTDSLGNSTEMTFTVIESVVGKFEKEIKVDGVEKVLVNGTEITIDAGVISLTESGTYEVSVIAGGKTETFTVTVDATAPSVTLTGVENGGETKEAVIINDLSENADVKVTKDGEEIAYNLGDEITEPGEYKVTVTDEIGNTAEYNFTIKAGLNGGIIALIVIVSLLVVGGVVVFILKKKEVI